MAIGIFPNQDCIFISARIWIMVQMSFEYCSVVVSNTELYLFFGKNSEGCVVWLKPLKVFAHVTSVTLICISSLVVIL